MAQPPRKFKAGDRVFAVRRIYCDLPAGTPGQVVGYDQSSVRVVFFLEARGGTRVASREIGVQESEITPEGFLDGFARDVFGAEVIRNFVDLGNK